MMLEPARVLTFLLFSFTSGSGSISPTEIIGTLGLTCLLQLPSKHSVSVSKICNSKSSSEDGFGFGGIKFSITSHIYLFEFNVQF